MGIGSKGRVGCSMSRRELVNVGVAGPQSHGNLPRNPQLLDSACGHGDFAIHWIRLLVQLSNVSILEATILQIALRIFTVMRAILYLYWNI